MSVGAINSSIYSSSTQYFYFGTSLSSARIQSLLKKYGITESDDSSTTLQELYDAIKLDAEATAQVMGTTPSDIQKTKQTQTNIEVPWANLMSQVGLNATGVLTTDQESFNQIISEMEFSATTPQQKASIDQIKAESYNIFIQDQSSEETSVIQSTASASMTITGADIQSQLNKLFLLG